MKEKKLKSCYFAFLQNTPFSTVRYSLIGDENAQVFFRVDDQTGQVFTNGPSLFSDQGTIYQVKKRLAVIKMKSKALFVTYRSMHVYLQSCHSAFYFTMKRHL